MFFDPLLVTVVVAVLFFLWVWFMICLVVSWLGGWTALGRLYAVREHLEGTTFRWQNAMFGCINYSNCLTMRVSPAGLYVAVFPFFRMGHPPLLIPWTDITDLREKPQMFGRVADATVGEPVVGRIRLPIKVYEEVQKQKLWPPP
jgi:hypothetical protein